MFWISQTDTVQADRRAWLGYLIQIWRTQGPVWRNLKLTLRPITCVYPVRTFFLTVQGADIVHYYCLDQIYLLIVTRFQLYLSIQPNLLAYNNISITWEGVLFILGEEFFNHDRILNQKSYYTLKSLNYKMSNLNRHPDIIILRNSICSVNIIHIAKTTPGLY